MVLWWFWTICGAFSAPVPSQTAETVEVRGRRPLRSASAVEFPLDRLFLPPLGSPQKVLESSLSVQTRETGSGEGEWILRGQDPVQSQFFLEGIPLSTSLYQRAQLTPVPWEAVRAVELTAGGIPASFGKGGLGGAVNLVLGPPRGMLGLRAGQWGKKRAFGGWSGGIGGNVEVEWGEGTFPYLDDGGTPFNPQDDRPALRRNNRHFQVSLLPQWDWGKNEGFVLAHFSRRQLPGPIHLPRPGQLEEGRVLVGSRQRWSSRWLSRLHLRGEQFEWKSQSAFPSSVPGRVSGWGGGHDLQYEGRWLHVGLGVRGEEFWTDGRKQRSWEFPLSVQGYLWDRSLRPALLVAYADQRAGEDHQTFSGVSPRLAWVKPLHPQWQGRVALSYVYRFPSLGERFGAPPFQSPNPKLKMERAWRVEVGGDGRWHWGKWTNQVSLTGFGQWSRELVAYENNAQRETVAVNVGRSTLLGVEANWRGTWKGWEARWGVGLMESLNETPVAYWKGNRLPHRPQWSGRGGLGWRSGDWQVEYRLSLVSGSYTDLANRQWTSGYDLHGVELRWESEVGTWALEGRNLTNVISVDSALGAFSSQSFVGGFLGYPSPGRQVFLSWRTGL